MAVAHEGLGSGVQYDGAIDEHPVVVVPGALRNAGVGPYTIGAFDHVVRQRVKRTLAGGDQGNLDLLRVRSGEVERHAIALFNPRILRAIDIVRVRMCRYGGGIRTGHRSRRQLLPGGRLGIIGSLFRLSETDSGGQNRRKGSKKECSSHDCDLPKWPYRNKRGAKAYRLLLQVCHSCAVPGEM